MLKLKKKEMQIEIKKLYKGMVEVRDYTVEECIKKGHALRIKFDGEVMILTPHEMENNIKSKSKPIKSRFHDGSSYILYGYKWNPNEISY
jgi:hypothetical protein